MSEPSPRILRAISSLQRLTDLFRERRRQLAREVGLSEAQWQLLEEIAGEGFMPSLFARRRSCSPAAVSHTLRLLLERQLISVALSTEDGRQRVYRLTAAGRRLLRRVRSSRERAIARVWSGLRSDEVEAFAGHGGGGGGGGPFRR